LRFQIDELDCISGKIGELLAAVQGHAQGWRENLSMVIEKASRIYEQKRSAVLAATELEMYQAAASVTAFFRFLCQPNKPIAPRPLANNRNAAGSGVVDTGT
jgi:hypothetical protein